MIFTRYRIAKATHGSQEWLNQRYEDDNGNRRISASAAAAIYGVHPFVPADVYAAELLSGVAPSPIAPNKAMDRGNRLEGTIISWASDLLGIEFDTPEELFCYDTEEGCHLISTLDGWNEEQKHILEVKTTTREWHGELPNYWRIQGLQQAICADAKRVTWAVFDPSLNLHIYEQTITEKEIEELASLFAKKILGSTLFDPFLIKGYIDGYTQAQEDMTDETVNYQEWKKLSELFKDYIKSANKKN